MDEERAGRGYRNAATFHGNVTRFIVTDSDADVIMWTDLH